MHIVQLGQPELYLDAATELCQDQVHAGVSPAGTSGGQVS